MNDFITVKAKIKILTAEDGGKRQTGIANGYRPNHVFELPHDGRFVTHVGEINFDGVELIYPGDERDLNITFVKTATIEKYMFNGSEWWIYEVPNLIAKAKILEIL